VTSENLLMGEGGETFSAEVAIEKLKTYEECENKKNIYDLC
jgi:hypothetical protein